MVETPFSPHSLIAFTGLKGSGKDTAGKFLTSLHGHTPVSFASFLKSMCMSFIVSQGADLETAQRLTNGTIEDKETPSVFFNNCTPRHAMQTLGTEWGRNLLGDDIWVNALRNKLLAYPNQKYVITDLRFENEVEMVKDLGGTVVRINRQELTDKHFADLNSGAKIHISEQLVPFLPVDFEIANNHSLERFENDVRTIFQNFS